MRVPAVASAAGGFADCSLVFSCLEALDLAAMPEHTSGFPEVQAVAPCRLCWKAQQAARLMLPVGSARPPEGLSGVRADEVILPDEQALRRSTCVIQRQEWVPMGSVSHHGVAPSAGMLKRCR